MARNPLKARGERSYWVWIKGKRASTQTLVSADTKPEAIWKAAKAWNVKTIELDGQWIRN